MTMPSCDVCRGACCEIFATRVRRAIVSDVEHEWSKVRSIAELEGERLVYLCICPQLTSDGRCGIQETKPVACRTFPVGCGECLDAIRLRRPEYAKELGL